MKWEKLYFLGQGNCATCHTLADAKSSGQIGPNLNQLKPDMTKVIYSVTNGIGVMPPYEGQLTIQENRSSSPLCLYKYKINNNFSLHW